MGTYCNSNSSSRSSFLSLVLVLSSSNINNSNSRNGNSTTVVRRTGTSTRLVDTHTASHVLTQEVNKNKTMKLKF